MRSVVICGSNKFAKEARAFGAKLRKLGVTVFIPHFDIFRQKHLDTLNTDAYRFVALGLTYDHFQKIQNADVVFIYNKGGYSGNSTTLEIGYAAALGKPIYALAKDSGEVCRDVLFREIISTPQELVKRL